MPVRDVSLPFEHILGLEDAKTALLCMAVDRDIRGLVIRGPSGVGKTTLIRSLTGRVFEREPVNIPMNASDEQIFGTVDLEHAIRTGELRLSKGILSKADGGTVVIDDVNLFDRRFVHSLMSAVSTGKVVVERDGLSDSYDCSVSIVATVNSREPALNPGIADLFDMGVTICEPKDAAYRAEVTRTNLDFQEGLYDGEDADGSMLKRVEEARRMLPQVRMDEGLLDILVDLNDKLHVEGFRGVLSTVRVCKAITALDGRKDVTKDDLVKAASLCLEHRRVRDFKDQPEFDDTIKVTITPYLIDILRRTNQNKMMLDKVAKERAEEKAASDPSAPVMMESAPAGSGNDDGVSEEVVTKVGALFESIDLIEDSRKKFAMTDAKQERKMIKTNGRNGRYTSSKPLEKGGSDIAIDATIRNAAPFQRSRHEADPRDGLILENRDLMEKVREKHTSCMFFFLVDNSGSLIIGNRITAVKAAILSMLKDHYVRRDTVAVAVFNDRSIGMVQPPTRSIGGIRKALKDIKVGSKTPLSEALMFTDDYARNYIRKHSGEQVYVIIMTDGFATTPLVDGADPIEESHEVAKTVSHDSISWIVVDTVSKKRDVYPAEGLAKSLKAPYYKLDALKSSDRQSDIWEMASERCSSSTFMR